ncbi:KpsF/GutQ family sugar-phosphate isomerase [Kaistia dalseonensis]|uniref:Arabinose-5-phosphate isomerase n=1 Tax=Kaistia dalseonensis TaxID=410840 RepID=A0ABU0HB03_9HYPH|nr:KpsF/GutQ family sugar-phosphate isomerase [Kaistia dalseonensis]MCX5496863.1 KpsF/GutQ family sugar-phosphate isomerase [Kaistia dalseonensis]MDQ0439489.1 arabinose-5-phosphate isomerase [Kaistia dalseonensis]
MQNAVQPSAIVAGESVASGIRTIESERAGLDALVAALAGPLAAPFATVIDLVRRTSGRVVVTGVGKSGHVGVKIAATLASTGTPALFVHAAEASHGDLGMVARDDVILALSWSGETAELRAIVEFARRFRNPLIAMTSNAESSLGRQADHVLLLPKAEEACPHGLAPTTSAVMQLALGDALAIALLETRGFTAQDFRLFHPGGRLGASLHFVRDIMHRDEALPLVATATSMSEAIVAMTAKGFGCLGVLDRDGMLIGIITDGDLRRHLGPDLLSRTVDEVMTRAPKTIVPDMLVGTAIDLLNTAKITAFFVVENRRPVGILHMHDLLRIGVA